MWDRVQQLGSVKDADNRAFITSFFVCINDEKIQYVLSSSAHTLKSHFSIKSGTLADFRHLLEVKRNKNKECGRRNNELITFDDYTL